MPMTMKLALEDGESEMKKIEARNKAIRKIAWRPSKRQRELDSKKAERIAGRPELLYTGDELKRRPR